MPGLATTKGIEVALITRLESNLDLESLGVMLDKYDYGQDRVPRIIRILRFLLSPSYKNLTSTKKSRPFLYGSLIECMFRNFGKGFFVATWATALLDALPLLLRGKAIKAGSVMFAPIHLQHGVAFGLFVCIFNSTLYAVSSGSPAEMENARRKNAWLAGLLAGGSVMFAPKETRYFTAQLTATRSLEVLARLVYSRASARGKRFLDDVGLSEHGDTMTMMFASYVVLNDFLEGGNNIQKNYLKFLEFQGGHSNAQLARLNGIIKGTEHGKSCKTLHPLEPQCTKYWGKFLIDSFVNRAVPMYSRVFALPLLFGLLQGKKPVHSTVSFFKGVAQSSVFLAMYSTIAWSTVCMMKDASPSFRKTWSTIIIGLAAGSMLLLEKKGRRLEVALFVLSQAISILLTRSRIKFPAHADSAVAMLSCSFLMYAYLNDAELIRPGYRFLLERFLDSRTDRHASIIPRVLSQSVALNSP